MTNQIETTETTEVGVTRADVRKGTIRLFDGKRKVGEWTPEGKVPEAVLQGVVAALGLPAEIETLKGEIEAAVAAALARKGSVIPDHYRHSYGVDQNCGDDMATALLAAVGGGLKDPLDLEALKDVAAENGIAERLDQWLTKGLNNGMLRMNTSNVLRGKLRRGEAVTIKGQPVA